MAGGGEIGHQHLAAGAFRRFLSGSGIGGVHGSIVFGSSTALLSALVVPQAASVSTMAAASSRENSFFMWSHSFFFLYLMA